MPLKLYDSKDAVPEAQRATAVETKDGKFAVAEDDPALGAAGKKAIDEERAARQTAEAALKAEKKRADDLQRAADARAKGISDEELERIRETEAAVRKPIEDERDRLAAENRKLKLTDRVQTLALRHGVMQDRLEDAMLALSTRTDLTDNDGIVVKDKAGKVTTETIDDFLKTTFKKEKPWFYAGSGASGSGSPGSSGSGEPAEPPPANPEHQTKRRREVAGAF